MADADNPYDAVAYPSLIFRHYHPDRLAAIARLHGLEPPPVETARVLEVGGGDGLNALALAAAYPRAEIVNFDLAADPIARGRAWAAAAGLANVRNEVLDILDAPDRLEGRFDYIAAHGIYAWVPDPVREGVMALFGRLLSPNGVAFVSYNALPGGHSRIALREMILHQVSHIASPRERIEATRALLRRFVEPGARDEPITAAMRKEAEATLAQPDGQLFHDQLGPIYAPQSLSDTVAAAARHGLRYLGDARANGQDMGFVDVAHADISDAALVHALQGHDHRHGRYFRMNLFIRDGQPIARVPEVEAMTDMWASSEAAQVEATTFRLGRTQRAVRDARLAEALRSLVAQRPRWSTVPEAVDRDLWSAFVDLALGGFVDLHTTAPTFSAGDEPRPRVSPLARMQIAAGERRIVTLDHHMVELESEPLRQALLLMDGEADRAELARRWAKLPWAAHLRIEDAIATAAQRALLTP